MGEKNRRSSATGPAQFLDETWLQLIRAHRPDLFRGRSQDQILELRRDAKVAREITIRFTEKNAEVLRKRGLLVTPGTLYLAHFAGGAGAVAILTAPDHADAAMPARLDVTTPVMEQFKRFLISLADSNSVFDAVTHGKRRSAIRQCLIDGFHGIATIIIDTGGSGLDATIAQQTRLGKGTCDGAPGEIGNGGLGQ